MFACNHNVDVMAAAQAMVHHGEEAICIGGKINTNNLSLFVYDVVDEARILMREAVMILPPDMGRQKVV